MTTPHGITFGIITCGDISKNDYLIAQVNSILTMDIPLSCVQIIIIGGEQCHFDHQVIEHYPFNEQEKPMWITRKKNLITKYAKYDIIVYTHDYINFDQMWYQGLIKYIDEKQTWDILLNPIINIDGTRFRDWVIDPHRPLLNEHGLILKPNLLLPYHVNIMELQYINGTYWVARKQVMVDNPLPEHLCWGDSEDIIWSRLLQLGNKYILACNTYSRVYINKPGKTSHFNLMPIDTTKFIYAIRKINTIIFDLDGVLVDSCDLHYHALNDALGEKWHISYYDHLTKYNGLSTRSKLLKMNIPAEYHDDIWRRKQELTMNHIAKYINEDKQLVNKVKCLRSLFKIKKLAVASNCIRDTVYSLLRAIGFHDPDNMFDIILSNEDVTCPKPNSEIYLTAMQRLQSTPMSTIIVEDSKVGLTAAYNSGAYVYKVIDSLDVHPRNILTKYSNHKDMRTKLRINCVIPMSGDGSRFKMAGYTDPKPFIHVAKKNMRMIEVVLDNLNLDANFIFIAKNEHIQSYHLVSILENVVKSPVTVIGVDKTTQGAACSILLARDIINNETPLLIVNSDQYVEWDSDEFYNMCRSIRHMPNGGGVISTFTPKPDDAKWSFAQVDDHGNVIRVAEKEVISNIATTGIYFWNKGCEFVRCANDMIQADDRVRGEFYVCPVFNYGIKHGLVFKTHHVKRMWSLGVPDDLDVFNRTFEGDPDV